MSDVPAEATVEAMAETTHEASGPVDVLVNNAGLTIDETFGNTIRRGGETVRGQQGNADHVNSTATTPLLFGYTRTIALELAATGPTATCIVLGFVETNMLETVPKRVRETILRDIPLNRFATSEDIAGMER